MTPGGTSGVPTAPRRMQSNARNSPSTSSDRISPSRRYRDPPRSKSVVAMSTPAARTTLTASAVTSGPMPSPPITAMLCVMGGDPTAMGLAVPRTDRTQRAGEAGASVHDRYPPLTMAAVHLSPAAYERLKAEFDDLTTRGRIDVANKIERAREEGDLKENAGYHAAKDEQGHMEGRIRQLEHLLENAEIVDGSFIYTVVYEGDSEDDAERYLIGNIEEQVQGADVISPSSPLGQALEGAEAGATITYEAPNGALTVTVLRVEPA